jgi:Outer membrane lipoprotein
MAPLSLVLASFILIQTPQTPQNPQLPSGPPESPNPDPHNTRVVRPHGQDERELGTRDPALEKRAEKNIEIAQFYMKQKNFKASINRLSEIYEVYPQYTRFDRVLLLLGRCHIGQTRVLTEEAKQLSGQKQDDKAKIKQEEAAASTAEAKKYLQELIAKFADTDTAKDAKKELEKLK